MAVFGFVVLCILAALFAILLAVMFITGSIYLISYIRCDFSERERRWKAESRDRQIYKYIQNLMKYKSEDCEESEQVKCDEDSVEDESEENEDNEKSNFDDVIDNALNK